MKSDCLLVPEIPDEYSEALAKHILSKNNLVDVLHALESGQRKIRDIAGSMELTVPIVRRLLRWGMVAGLVRRLKTEGGYDHYLTSLGLLGLQEIDEPKWLCRAAVIARLAAEARASNRVIDANLAKEASELTGLHEHSARRCLTAMYHAVNTK